VWRNVFFRWSYPSLAGILGGLINVFLNFQVFLLGVLALLRSGKVYVKISAAYRISQQPHYPDVVPIARAMIAANPDRIVWGTDWPHPGAARRDPAVIEPFRPEDDGAALSRVAQWAQDRTTLRKILVDNPARLYQF